MTASGWYPDPGGSSGRFRYWNGTGWSAETTDDPADPPPNLRPRPSTRPRPERGAGTGFGIAALVLVVVLVSAVLIIKRSGQAAGWNEPQALPSSAAGTTAGQPAGSPIATPGGPDCTAGDPDQLSPHPSDDRVHGGRLSMMAVPDYAPPAPEYLLSWMEDTQGVDQETEPGWQSIFAVGEVARTAGFSTPEQAARSSMTCALTNSWYYDIQSRKDIRNESIIVDGRPGWILTAEIHDGHPAISAEGDQLTFLAVDDGREDAFSMWCGMVPLGDSERIALDQKVLASLRVES